MSAIEMGEKLVSEIDEAIGKGIVSAVIYGKDIHRDMEVNNDCNLLLVLEKVDLPTVEKIHKKIKDAQKECLKTPLIIEQGEIEGMMDSVPPTFLKIMISYQTIYGKQIFKGLSSLNHEHLRAQTEQSLREELFCARYRFLQGLDKEDEMRATLMDVGDTLKRSIDLYYLIKKPWITDEKEKWDTFQQDFGVNDPWMKQMLDLDTQQIGLEEMKKIGISIIDNGLKALLDKVDQMGP